MKFLEEFIPNYINCYDNNKMCMICNTSITNGKHGTLCCKYYSDHFDIYGDKIIIIIRSQNTYITLYFNDFKFMIGHQAFSINYEKEFDNIFELKDYCLDTYNRYKKNLIFL